MNPNVKKISPVLFFAAGLLFCMPFLSISCYSQKVLTLSAIQLITGTDVQQNNGLGGRENQHIDPSPFVVAAFVMTIAGIALGFLRGKSSTALAFIIGVANFSSLLLFKNKTDAEVLQQGQGMLQVEYEAGFWLIIAITLLAVTFNVFLLLAKSGHRESSA